ncbi:hypothetical protein [Acinetobacter calcoaceticus]
MENFKDFDDFMNHCAEAKVVVNVDVLAWQILRHEKIEKCRKSFEAQKFVADLLEYLIFDSTQNKYFIKKTGVSEHTFYRINGAWQAWQIRQNEVNELRSECERLQDQIIRIKNPDTQDSYNFAQAFYRRVVKATDQQLPKELSDLKIDPSFVKAMFIAAMGVFPEILEMPNEVVGGLKIDANHIHSSIP